MSLHDGHRDRLRKRYLEEGLDHFTEVQVLELMLFYSIPRKDTNELAHRLLDRFGSLSQVLDTRPEDLMQVEGIGENAALFISLFPSVARYYDTNQAQRMTILKDVDECGQYLLGYFKNRTNETVFLLCLDAKRKVLCCQMVGEGSVNSAGVPIRRIVEMALAANATTVVLAHNHSSGLALPSREDVMTTRRLAAALDGVDVILADHLVIADGEFVSMVQSGYYRPGECGLRI